MLKMLYEAYRAFRQTSEFSYPPVTVIQIVGTVQRQLGRPVDHSRSLDQRHIE